MRHFHKQMSDTILVKTNMTAFLKLIKTVSVHVPDYKATILKHILICTDAVVLSKTSF